MVFLILLEQLKTTVYSHSKITDSIQQRKVSKRSNSALSSIVFDLGTQL